MGKKRLTPNSHYEASIILHNLLMGTVPSYVNWNITDSHIQMLKMFIIDGLNAQEISKSGIVTSNRGKAMGPDMVMLWIHRYFPTLEFEESTVTSRRNKDRELCRQFRKMKETLPKTPCACCGSMENLELDHIVPWDQGGALTEENLQWLCHNCHNAKTKAERQKYGWHLNSPTYLNSPKHLAEISEEVDHQ